MACDHPLAGQLEAGTDALGLSLSGAQISALLAYIDLLARWNKAYNLTAVRDPAEMVTRHLLDSLSVAPWLVGERLIDVGAGGGLPGVPLAIACPQRQFHLLDSNGKKTRFLFQVKTALGLANITVHQARVESFSADQPYDAILSRAFATLEDIALNCRHLLAPSGRFLAMKGAVETAEVRSAQAAGMSVKVQPLVVPGLFEERHLVEMSCAV